MKRTGRIILVLTIPILFVILLSIAPYINSNRKNGFVRRYTDLPKQPLFIVPFEEEITDVAGYTTSNIFVSTTNPETILTISSSGILSQKHVSLGKLMKPFKTFIDSPDIFIASGNNKVMCYANFNNDSIVYFSVKGELFSRVTKIPAGSFIFRQFVHKSKDPIFIKRTPETFDSISTAVLTSKFHDGGVLTDGMLVYERETEHVIYIYFHKGSYLTCDTDLNNIREGKTIDTFKGFHDINFKTGKGREDFLSINLAACAYKKFLLIYSTVKADNETSASYSKNFDIDVYDLNTMKYSGSFLVPKSGQTRIQAMKICNNSLVVLYPHLIIKFSLPELMH